MDYSLKWTDGFREEGCLRKHEVFLGREWDLHILALYRETWNQRERKLREVTARNAIALDIKQRAGGPTFEEFIGFLVSSLGLEDFQLDAESRLVEDIGFDSIQMYETLSAIEDLGACIPDSALEQIRTVGDLHFHTLQWLS